MPRFLFALFLFSLTSLTSGCKFPSDESHNIKPPGNPRLSTQEKQRLKQHALTAATFIKQQHFNSQFCFLVDIDRPSGKNRFFVYDLEKDSLEMAGLVAHGNCNERWLKGRKYSNEIGCGCTSLGRYKIGNPYSGHFGLAYKLYGLDTSNSNAFSRNVVLHAYPYE